MLARPGISYPYLTRQTVPLAVLRLPRLVSSALPAFFCQPAMVHMRFDGGFYPHPVPGTPENTRSVRDEL
jgi:hypothetical protein